MEKIPSAEELIRAEFCKGEFEELMGCLNTSIEPSIICAMKEFAKLHVEAALKSVIINRDSDEDSFYIFGSLEDESRIGNYDLSGLRCSLNKDSILNCYPLENIK